MHFQTIRVDWVVVSQTDQSPPKLAVAIIGIPIMIDGDVIHQTDPSPPTTAVTILTIVIDGVAVGWNNLPHPMTNVAIIAIMVMMIFIDGAALLSIIMIIA